MIHPAGDYVVYPCGACGKRIFTEQGHVGRTAVCPLCEAEHVVGGTPTVSADAGVERRRADRVEVNDARVGLGSPSPEALLASDELHAVQDLSETGLAFAVPAVPDPRHLSGHRPPDVEVGQSVRITLHTRELFRPRTYRAEVRRVDPRDARSYVVGVRFTGLTPEQEAELSALVRRLGSGP